MTRREEEERFSSSQRSARLRDRRQSRPPEVRAAFLGSTPLLPLTP